jgi:hypothetical protein
VESTTDCLCLINKDGTVGKLNFNCPTHCPEEVNVRQSYQFLGRKLKVAEFNGVAPQRTLFGIKRKLPPCQ